MSAYPKDGSTFVTEIIERKAYRWAKYKPDGARQMGKPGRWQKQVCHGEYFKWENCDEPEGILSPPVDPGPISMAFMRSGALDHWRQEVGKLHSRNATLEGEVKSLREALRGMLEAHSKPDERLCCDGRDCGCMGSTVHQQAEHYARAALQQGGQ